MGDGCSPAWGLSRTWCGAAESYIDMNVQWKRKHSPPSPAPMRPLSCGITPRPIYHVSTKSINKTSRFIMAGKRISSKVDKLFPQWHRRYKVAYGYPNGIVRLAWDSHRSALRRENITYGGSDLSRSSSCGHATAFGHSAKLSAFVWI